VHEHQSPAAWSRQRGGTADEDLFQFDCSALQDYARCRNAVSGLYDGNQEHIKAYMDTMCWTAENVIEYPCTDGKDNEFHLSAWNWLPAPGSQEFIRASSEIDLESIMMYYSSTGSRDTQNEPVLLLIQGDELFTFGSVDGYENYPVSPLDVEGATLLSPAPRDSTSNPPLFSPASSYHATWEASAGQECQAGPSSTGSSRRRSPRRINKRHENLKRRAAEARAAMGRGLAAGSYI
jgi:hypothetical protein